MGTPLLSLQHPCECAKLPAWLYVMVHKAPPSMARARTAFRRGRRIGRLSRVGVAQLGRALDCGSSGRGFKSHRSPSAAGRRMRAVAKGAGLGESKAGTGPLAQLVEQRTLNPSVEGSIPSRLIVGCLVKLVDTLALGASTLTGVRVRVSGQPLYGHRAAKASEAFGNNLQ